MKEEKEKLKKATKEDPYNYIKTIVYGTPKNAKESIEALRYNAGKARYDLQHPVATKGLVDVLTKGAQKYEEKNWEKGMSWSSVLASMKRHIAAFESGEDYDPETGLLHVDHIQCNAHFLSAYYKIAPQYDDRRHRYLKTLKIGLDIDEVLCDWLGAWTKKFNLDVPKSWFFQRNITDKFNQLKKKGELDKFYANLKPLIKPTDIPFEPHCYITSRPVDVSISEKWIDDNGFPTRPVYSVGSGKSKVEVAKESGIDIFVDDRYENFVELNKAGICCYLFDQPHNQRYDVGHKRIKSLMELKDLH